VQTIERGRAGIAMHGGFVEIFSLEGSAQGISVLLDFRHERRNGGR
jgi:hypothetical protein